MVAIDSLMDALDERTIARQVGLRHDEARMAYPLRRNTVVDFDEFSEAIADYYNYHFVRCVTGAGSLTRLDARGRAKEAVEQEYRRQNGDIMTAFNNALDGTNGGMRAILDGIAESMKGKAVELHIRDAFDRHVAPNSWEQKVEIIRQFIVRCGAALGASIDPACPERYAQSFRELIQAYVQGLQRTSAIFRRF